MDVCVLFDFYDFVECHIQNLKTSRENVVLTLHSTKYQEKQVGRKSPTSNTILTPASEIVLTPTPTLTRVSDYLPSLTLTPTAMKISKNFKSVIYLQS